MEELLKSSAVIISVFVTMGGGLVGIMFTIKRMKKVDDHEKRIIDLEKNDSKKEMQIELIINKIDKIDDTIKEAIKEQNAQDRALMLELLSKIK